MKCEWKVELVKWYQPHMVSFYLVFILCVMYIVSCNKILQLHMLTPFESLTVVSFMAILITINISIWNNCMIRQTVEEVKSELKRLE